MRTAADLHTHLASAVHAAEAAAMRADNDGIRRVADELAVGGLLDEHTVAFVRRSQHLVIGLTAALNAVLDAHRGLHDRYGSIGCRECTTPASAACRTLRRIGDVVQLYSLRRLPVVDVAEAFRRARRHDVVGGKGSELVSSVEEISDGFVFRHLRLDLPPPLPVPDPNGERVLIVDKASGVVSIWPLMPLATIDRHYKGYRQGHGTLAADPNES